MKKGQPEGKAYLTPKEAATRAGVCITTLYRWILRGKLRARRRAGSRYLIEAADVDAVVQVVEPRGGLKAGMHETAMAALREAGLVE